MNEHLTAVAAMIPGNVFTEPPKTAALKKSDGSWDGSKFPHTIVTLDGGARSTERYAVAPHHADYTIRTVVVGLSVAQVQAARDRVVDALALKRPTVAGRVMGRIEHIASAPSAVDTDVPDRSIFVAPDNWTVTSTAA